MAPWEPVSRGDLGSSRGGREPRRERDAASAAVTATVLGQAWAAVLPSVGGPALLRADGPAAVELARVGVRTEALAAGTFRADPAQLALRDALLAPTAATEKSAAAGLARRAIAPLRHAGRWLATDAALAAQSVAATARAAARPFLRAGRRALAGAGAARERWAADRSVAGLALAGAGRDVAALAGFAEQTRAAAGPARRAELRTGRHGSSRAPAAFADETSAAADRAELADPAAGRRDRGAAAAVAALRAAVSAAGAALPAELARDVILAAAALADPREAAVLAVDARLVVSDAPDAARVGDADVFDAGRAGAAAAVATTDEPATTALGDADLTPALTRGAIRSRRAILDRFASSAAVVLAGPAATLRGPAAVGVAAAGAADLDAAELAVGAATGARRGAALIDARAVAPEGGASLRRSRRAVAGATEARTAVLITTAREPQRRALAADPRVAPKGSTARTGRAARSAGGSTERSRRATRTIDACESVAATADGCVATFGVGKAEGRRRAESALAHEPGAAGAVRALLAVLRGARSRVVDRLGADVLGGRIDWDRPVLALRGVRPVGGVLGRRRIGGTVARRVRRIRSVDHRRVGGIFGRGVGEQTGVARTAPERGGGDREGRERSDSNGHRGARRLKRTPAPCNVIDAMIAADSRTLDSVRASRGTRVR